MTDKDLINAIVYTDFHDQLGPNPIYWYPLDLSEKVRMLVGIKTVTILSGSHGYVPDSLLIIPFPSIQLKGVIKFIERKDNTRRGGTAQYAITLLFKEADDIIFYKYIMDFESLFNETALRIIKLEDSNSSNQQIFAEIDNLKAGVLRLLNELKMKEFNGNPSEAFPEISKTDEKVGDFIFKMVVLGDPGVGKTSTILRFTDKAFNRTYLPTMGTNITNKSFRVDNNIAEIILWDIAGQSKFQVMRKYFYQGAEAIMLIFDLTNQTSFESIPEWYKDIKKNITENQIFVGYILGNKLDLAESRKVSKLEAQSLAKDLNLDYIEISALTGKNIENAFYNIAKALIKLKNLPPMNN